MVIVFDTSRRLIVICNLAKNPVKLCWDAARFAALHIYIDVTRLHVDIRNIREHKATNGS